jgi:hypothetical protein
MLSLKPLVIVNDSAGSSAVRRHTGLVAEAMCRQLRAHGNPQSRGFYFYKLYNLEMAAIGIGDDGGRTASRAPKLSNLRIFVKQGLPADQCGVRLTT